MAALAAGLALVGTPASADPTNPGPAGAAKGRSGDIQPVAPDLNGGKKLPLDRRQLQKLRTKMQAQNRRQSLAAANASVGETKTWLGLNDYTGGLYLKSYTMRGIGDHIQVWVADDRAFPAGDCRNDLDLTQVTDAQVDSFIHEFDTNIYPTESTAFSTPPDRDGSGATLPDLIGAPADYYQVGADQADDIVVLVDNVRDANYYAPDTPDGQTYIAGFFYSVFNEYYDRNVMTIDAYDWLHRTGANPPDDSTDPAYVACAQAQGQTRGYGAAKPHLYEGTFAHEYQHLLEYYEDPAEVSWVNEGLSDWAQTLVGYVDPSIPPDQPGADSHLACIQGFQDPKFGGPENSLTEWSDQGGPEILCDYGAAYSFMEYLQSHYGDAFMTALHREDRTGLAGLDAVLDRFHVRRSAMDTVHDWAAALALDAALQRDGRGHHGHHGHGRDRHHGGLADVFSIATMQAKVNWDTAQAYDTPGAPPNGSDYVRLRNAGGSYLTAKQLRSISFAGAQALEPTPLAWTSEATPPDATVAGADSCGSPFPAGSGPAALYSGCGDDLDRSLVRQVSVPTDDPTMRFSALWDIEQGWDFAFLQVSDDGGATWHSLSTADTTAEHDPGAQAEAVANLPGFTGDSGTWQSESVDLSAYAGKDVLIGFRYLTDAAAAEAGFWVRDLQVGGTALPTSLDGWQTMSQAHPTPVSGFTVQLVGYDSHGTVVHHTMRLDRHFRGHLGRGMLRRVLGTKATTTAAIVMYDDPTETSTQQARYTLKVNGVLQPGG